MERENGILLCILFIFRLKGSSEKDNTQLFQESIQLNKDRLVMTVAQLLLEEVSFNISHITIHSLYGYPKSAVPLSESLSSLSTLQSTLKKKGNSSRKVYFIKCSAVHKYILAETSFLKTTIMYLYI